MAIWKLPYQMILWNGKQCFLSFLYAPCETQHLKSQKIADSNISNILPKTISTTLLFQLDSLSLVSSCRSGLCMVLRHLPYNAKGEHSSYKTQQQYQIQNSEIDTFSFIAAHLIRRKKLDTVAIDFDGKKILWPIPHPESLSLLIT